MTVAELIEALKRQDPADEVMVETNDDYLDVSGLGYLFVQDADGMERNGGVLIKVIE